MAHFSIFLLVGTLAHATELFPRMPRVRYTKNGGMRFLRIGRLQTSFCICRASI